MKPKTEAIFSEVLQEVNPGIKELAQIKNSLNLFLKKIENKIKKSKIKASIFIGGSFAKNTLMKKRVYDIDIFIRFDKKYRGKDISSLTAKLLRGHRVKKLKGSRNYFSIKITPKIFFEVVPVLKISRPSESENITDLSYSHVSYIKRKASEKILEDIKLAKAFCYANRCYGAESYIKGFSGYGLELLVYHYKGFLPFIRAMAKTKKKTIIDIEKKYKNKKRILMDINESKLESPIILIDPTYKQRNVLAGLSEETFKKFQKACKKFVKNPSLNGFEPKKIDVNKIKEDAKSKKREFILLEAKTNKQEGDIAATKLLKFYNTLLRDVNKYFKIHKKGFNYGGFKAARFFFVVEAKEEITLPGPLAKQDKHVKKFKKAHRNTFKKLGRIYAREEIKFSPNQFLEMWKKENKRKIKDMYITSLETI